MLIQKIASTVTYNIKVTTEWNLTVQDNFLPWKISDLRGNLIEAEIYNAYGKCLCS